MGEPGTPGSLIRHKMGPRDEPGRERASGATNQIESGRFVAVKASPSDACSLRSGFLVASVRLGAVTKLSAWR